MTQAFDLPVIDPVGPRPGGFGPVLPGRRSTRWPPPWPPVSPPGPVL